MLRGGGQLPWLPRPYLRARAPDRCRQNLIDRSVNSEWNVSFEIVSIFELRAGCPNLGHGTLSMYLTIWYK